MLTIKSSTGFLTHKNSYDFGTISKAWVTNSYMEAKQVRDTLLYNGIACDIAFLS
jgi:hypothetical protein